MSTELERKIIDIIDTALRVSEKFDRVSTTKDELERHKEDPVFSLFMMASKQIIEARARGALVMSLTRKLGDIYENCVKEIVMHQLSLSANSIAYRAIVAGHERSLECRILLDDLPTNSRSVAEKLISKFASAHESKYGGKKDFIGMAFEVRYCYTIGDSKRIQADVDMAEDLFKKNILPIMLIFCTISLENVLLRFRNRSYWTVLEGLQSYAFLKELTGFDLYSFLKEDKEVRVTIESSMKKILSKFGESHEY